MKRLLALILVVFGCSSAEHRVPAPRAPLTQRAEPDAATSARIGPLAGLGAGVRRVDAELR